MNGGYAMAEALRQIQTDVMAVYPITRRLQSLKHTPK